MKISNYEICPLEKRPGIWFLIWRIEKEDETLYFVKQFKRQANAMIYLARLKDDQISEQQQLRFLHKRKSK